MKGDNELDNPDGEKREMKEEDFLNVPPCPFRRVSYGTTFCTISTDAFVAEVDPLTCLNCDVYSIISDPRCRFLAERAGWLSRWPARSWASASTT
jgi:hypothetical protein